MAPNDLPLLVGQESPPVRDFTGSLLDAAGHAQPWQVPRGHAQELHYLSIE
jgi:hypothetical protein